MTGEKSGLPNAIASSGKEIYIPAMAENTSSELILQHLKDIQVRLAHMASDIAEIKVDNRTHRLLIVKRELSD